MTYSGAQQQTNSPAYVNASSQKQARSLNVVRDLSGGTEVMRDRGEIYLPKEQGESVTAYDARKKRTLLFNTHNKTLEGLLGIALKKNPDLKEGKGADGKPDPVPELIRMHWEDIDLAGTSGDIFIKDLFRKIIRDGHAFIFVDMAPPLTSSITTLSPVPTALDDQVTGRRPHWVQYTKDQAINWKSDRINGETILTQITFKECATEDDGLYGEKEIVRYRVLRLQVIVPKSPMASAVYGPMEWAVYEEHDKLKEPIFVNGNVTDLPRIPVVAIYSRRTGFLESDPALLDLAWLNIGHWQQWSDLCSQLRMLVPILVIRGTPLEKAPEGDGAKSTSISVGAGATVSFAENSKDVDCGLEYVSHDGQAIQSTREALLDLESRMSAVGLSLIGPKPAENKQAATATEKVMDQDERTSELASWLRQLKDGIEMALWIHAQYLGLPSGGSIVLGFDEVDASDEESLMAIDAPKGTPPGNTALPPSSSMIQ